MSGIAQVNGFLIIAGGFIANGFWQSGNSYDKRETIFPVGDF